MLQQDSGLRAAPCVLMPLHPAGPLLQQACLWGAQSPLHRGAGTGRPWGRRPAVLFTDAPSRESSGADPSLLEADHTAPHPASSASGWNRGDSSRVGPASPRPTPRPPRRIGRGALPAPPSLARCKSLFALAAAGQRAELAMAGFTGWLRFGKLCTRSPGVLGARAVLSRGWQGERLQRVRLLRYIGPGGVLSQGGLEGSGPIRAGGPRLQHLWRRSWGIG